MNTYLSNAVREEVGIHLHDACTERFSGALVFLQSCLQQWVRETSPDGKIRKTVSIAESEDKSITVQYGPNNITIYFDKVPRIRETHWSELILKTQSALCFPNPYFLIDSNVLNALQLELSHIPEFLVCKAVLEICQATFIEENTFRTLQMKSAEIPTQEDLQTNPYVVLLDQYQYAVVQPQQVQQVPIPVPIGQAMRSALGALDEKDLKIIDAI